MTEYLSLFLSTVLVNNFVLTKFLGLCIFFGVSKNFDASAGMGIAVTAVMVIASFLGWIVHAMVLQPLHLEFFTTICFVIIIASTVQLLDTLTRKFVPTLHAMWGIYLMLIATNCIVLAVPLLNVDNSYSLAKSLVHSVGAGVGFAIAILLMSSIREKLQYSTIPKPLQGLGIAFIVAGLLSLAFLGFSGMISA